MKRTKSQLTTTLAPALLTLAVSVAAPAAYAGPIDTVISRVAQVKKDTAYLKTRALQVHVKSNELVQRAQETQSTLNTMIHEADLLKGALAPMKDAFENVRGIRERFQELDFNPVDLLHSPEFQDAIEMVRERREAMQERLHDPYIEDFRGEFLETLGQIRSLIEADAPVSEIHNHLTDEWFMPMRDYARYLLLNGLIDPVSVLAAFPSPPVSEESGRRKRM